MDDEALNGATYIKCGPSLFLEVLFIFPRSSSCNLCYPGCTAAVLKPTSRWNSQENFKQNLGNSLVPRPVARWTDVISSAFLGKNWISFSFYPFHRKRSNIEAWAFSPTSDKLFISDNMAPSNECSFPSTWKMISLYRVSLQIVHMNLVDFYFNVPQSHPAVELPLLNSYQQRAASGTLKIRLQPTQVQEPMGHPVHY